MNSVTREAEARAHLSLNQKQLAVISFESDAVLCGCVQVCQLKKVSERGSHAESKHVRFICVNGDLTQTAFKATMHVLPGEFEGTRGLLPL